MKTAINLALIFSCSPSVNDGGEKKKKKNLHPFTQKNGGKKKKRAHSSVEQSASRDLLE